MLQAAKKSYKIQNYADIIYARLLTGEHEVHPMSCWEGVRWIPIRAKS